MTIRNSSEFSGHPSAQIPTRSLLKASPVRQDSLATIACGEQWYFRIDGREYGPSSRDQLEKFLKPPRLCKSMEVMCTQREGTWFLVAKDETLETALCKFGILPAVNSATDSSLYKGSQVWDSICTRCETLAKKIVEHSLILNFIIVIAAVNLVFLYATDESHVRERVILSIYETIWKEARSFHPKLTHIDEWREFADDASKKIQPLLRELGRSANVRKPLRQQLLFAGRDHLAKLLEGNDVPAQGLPTTELIDKYLHLLREQLPR